MLVLTLLLYMVPFPFLTLVEAIFEDISIDPTNTYGMEIGELSFLQFILGCLIFLKLVILYVGGVLPVEVDLNFDGDNDYSDDYIETGRQKRSFAQRLRHVSCSCLIIE